MKDYIFFDLDGTLTDSQEGILNSLRYTLEFYGVEYSDERLKTFIGPPIVETFKKLGFLGENRVYDGIENLLKNLKNSGRHLAVATSKPEEYAIRIAEYFGIAKYFDCICGCNMDETRSDKAEVIEYALDSCGLNTEDTERVLMVGDRYTDIEGAHKNSICAAAVLYGYGSRKEFEEFGADYIVETVSGLQDLIEKL